MIGQKQIEEARKGSTVKVLYKESSKKTNDNRPLGLLSNLSQNAALTVADMLAKMISLFGQIGACYLWLFVLVSVCLLC